MYVEYSNEVWNGQFAQAGYATELGLALELSPDRYEARLGFYAQRSVEIFRQFVAVFGSAERLVRVLAWQSPGVDAAQQVLQWNDAYQQADALAIAPYIGGSLGLPDMQDEVAALPVEAILDRMHAEIPFVMAHVKQHARNAAELGLDLIAYEGGQHLVGVGPAQAHEQLTDKFIAAQVPSEKEWSYLSTHPAIHERIARARRCAGLPSNAQQTPAGSVPASDRLQ